MNRPTYRVAVLAGDGIGPEVIGQALRCLEVVQAHGAFALELEHLDLGADRYLRDGTTLPEPVFERLRAGTDAILLGALGDPRVPDQVHARDILLGLRQRLDLFANVRPLRCLDSRFLPLKDKRPEQVDMVVFRENTEGAYLGRGRREHEGTEREVGITEDVNTYVGVQRIVRVAFEHARTHGLDRVLMADKANAMPTSHALWRRVFAEVAKDFPEIAAETAYVDALCLQLVREPERFRVIVTNNLFGDILSDLGAALVGGLGMAPSMNIGTDRPGLFEPVHGSAPDIAGRGLANPFGAVLTAALMLQQLGQSRAAGELEAAVQAAVAAAVGTPDLGGSASTTEVGDWLVAWLRRNSPVAR